MKEGAITRGFLWNPIDAGYAMVALGQRAGQRAARSRTAWTFRASGRCKVDADIRVIRANKRSTSIPQSIDELGEDHLIAAVSDAWRIGTAARGAAQPGRAAADATSRFRLE